MLDTFPGVFGSVLLVGLQDNGEATRLCCPRGVSVVWKGQHSALDTLGSVMPASRCARCRFGYAAASADTAAGWDQKKPW